MVVLWRTRRGGSGPRVSTEHSLGPLVILDLYAMRQHYLREGGLVSTWAYLEDGLYSIPGSLYCTETHIPLISALGFGIATQTLVKYDMHEYPRA